MSTNVAAQPIDKNADLLRDASEQIVAAENLMAAGKYSAAAMHAERAVAIHQELDGQDSLETASSLDVLGRALRMSGDYRRAESALRTALLIRETLLGEDTLETAASLNDLGGYYYLVSDFDRAESMYRRALTIREKQLGPSHPDVAAVYHNLGGMYQTRGRNVEAEPYLRRALAIRLATLGSEHPRTADTLSVLGRTLADVGDFARAEDLLLRSLEVKERVLGPKHPDVSYALRDLAWSYYSSGSFADAESLDLRALEIQESSFGRDNTFVAGTLTALALLYARTGDYIRSEKLNLQALEIRQKLFGKDSIPASESLNNLGELNFLRGNYTLARSFLQKSLTLKKRLLRPTDPSLGIGLHNLALVNYRDGNIPRAAQLFQQALNILDTSLGGQHRYTLHTLNALAASNWTEGKTDDALKLLLRSQRSQSANSLRFLTSGSERRDIEFLKDLSVSTSEFVTFSVSVPGGSSASVGLTAALDLKSRILDSMAEGLSQLRESTQSEDRILLTRRAELANQYSSIAFGSAPKLPTDEYEHRVASLIALQERLDSDLAKRSSAMRQITRAPTIAQIRQALPSNAALLEWLRYIPFDPKSISVNGLTTASSRNPRYAAFLLTRDTDPVALDIGDAETIDHKLHDFRNEISRSSHTIADSKKLGGALSRELLEQILNRLPGIDHLFVSPDGELNLVPFAVLLDGDDRYLAERFEITYLTSGRDLVRATTEASQTPAVVFADPEFGLPIRVASSDYATPPAQRSAELDRSGMVFRPLESTALEATTLKDLLNLESSNVLVRGAATETELKKIHGPRILHVATHGFFLSDQDLVGVTGNSRSSGNAPSLIEENPLLRSGIALAGANERRSGENNDGILTALEAAQLDLHGTELVVLSACDTGVGDVHNGEGVYGLRRALILAGAQTQVTSLWKVSDEATRVLMVDFYERLLKGEGRSEALRHAQLDMLAKPEYSHPYYWASFIPIGNWKPLTKLN